MAVPQTITDAKRFVARVHRHLPAPQGALWAVGCRTASGIVGVAIVAIVGRPSAIEQACPVLDDGREYPTVEVTRLATDGTRNACSFLYGRVKQAAAALGYRRVLTYTLLEEGGASLRASGFVEIGETEPRPPGSWGASRVGRTMRMFVPEPMHNVAKTRWEIRL